MSLLKDIQLLGSEAVNSRALVGGVSLQPEPYLAPAESIQRAPGVPVGTLSAAQRYESRSAYPGFKFEYQLYVPAQYTAAQPAALMVFQDGKHYLGFTAAKFNSPCVFDNLIASGEVPVTLLLFIDPGTAGGSYRYPEHRALRSVQYDSLDDGYSRFLIEEVIPDLVASRYNVTADPDGWAIGGHSSGGICAFTVAWRHPDRFRRVLTHNGSFVDLRGGDAYPALVRDSQPKPLHVSLLSGTGDSVNDHGDWFRANRSLAHALDERGYRYRFRHGNGAHYPPLQAVADYPDALRWLWSGYRLPAL